MLIPMYHKRSRLVRWGGGGNRWHVFANLEIQNTETTTLWIDSLLSIRGIGRQYVASTDHANVAFRESQGPTNMLGSHAPACTVTFMMHCEVYKANRGGGVGSSKQLRLDSPYSHSPKYYVYILWTVHKRRYFVTIILGLGVFHYRFYRRDSLGHFVLVLTVECYCTLFYAPSGVTERY